MKTDDLQDLLDTVELVRLEREPAVSAELLQQVVLIEEANPDSDERALKAIREVVEAAVATAEGDA